MGVVTTSDKAWAPSSSTPHSTFFEDVDNDIPKENEEENARNDVHISNDGHIDENKKKSSKQIGGAVRLSGQIEKLCNAADNMSQATCSLTPAMDPYSIPQAIKVFDNM
ncbi:hypothetical protein Gogos_011583 [Gossypium gossypioides]|uniref:Uncharacterized protein n=1 Tax=Gossypium gossypioides TaxID=34282 RepID=A0A7J9BPS4_GOSGO|nr:hypothetical protein [Gossypium gossypioides]